MHGHEKDFYLLQTDMIVFKTALTRQDSDGKDKNLHLRVTM